jgi:hypothetical protein
MPRLVSSRKNIQPMDVSAYAIQVKDARRLFMRSSSVRQALEASLHARQVR